MTQLLYLSLIRDQVPDLSFHHIDQTKGQFNDILIINRQWVFRFPRYREGVMRLASEARLLETLNGCLPLATPKPLVRNLEPPVPGLAFLGYPLIPGKIISAGDLAQVSAAALDNLAAQLAGFLNALHRWPLTSLPDGLPGAQIGNIACEQRTDWEAMFARVREKLFPAMRADAVKGLTEHFEAYLDDSSLHKFHPTLRHGDFGGSNILWDPAWWHATGVVDFSFCAIGDPAFDLASISTLGDDFYSQVISHYKPVEDQIENMLRRARFYRGTFALMEALDGLAYGDGEAYQNGMAQYRD